MFLFPVVDSKDPNTWYVPSNKDQTRPVKAGEKIAWMVVKEGKPILEIFLNQTDEAAWIRRTLSAESKLQQIGECPLGKLIQAGVQPSAGTQSRFKDMTPEKELNAEIERIVQRTLEEVQREWGEGFPQAKQQVTVARPWKGFPDWDPRFLETELQYVDFGGWVKTDKPTSAPPENRITSFFDNLRFRVSQAFA